MNGRNLFTRFRQRLTALGRRAAPPAPEAVRLLQMVEQTRDDELSCDDVFAVLDQYAELAVQGVDVAGQFPLITHHLQMCRDCSEEHAALLRILYAK